jgi:predicted NUDIX family phosphoesterase
MDPEERVLVVPRSTVMDGSGWRGVRTDGLARVLEAIEHEGRFEPRSRVESDRALKQVIPYLVLRDGARYFLMRRTRAGGDARLHDRYSIGVGGHLNPGDGDIRGGLVREWREEIAAAFVPGFRVVGLLNDDETDVGAVHLGIVYETDVAGREVGVRETAKLSGAFAEPDEVAAVRDDLETWSALVFDHLERRGD